MTYFATAVATENARSERKDPSFDIRGALSCKGVALKKSTSEPKDVIAVLATLGSFTWPPTSADVTDASHECPAEPKGTSATANLGGESAPELKQRGGPSETTVAHVDPHATIS